MYHRVVPRDLFNEAKLLKCLAQLALIIHDGVDNRRQSCPKSLKHDHDGQPFLIEQRADGDLICETFTIFRHDQPLTLASSYNSKNNYTLYAESDEGELIEVFNDDGSLTTEFIEYCQTPT